MFLLAKDCPTKRNKWAKRRFSNLLGATSLLSNAKST